jgi:HEAT repeat protein
MLIAAVLIAGCGKKKEEAKPEQPAAEKANQPAQSTPYLDSLKAIAKRAAQEVEARGADHAKTARAAELVAKLRAFNYTEAVSTPEEASQEPGKALYLMPPVVQPSPVKDELTPVLVELAQTGLPAIPALMDGYVSITDIAPRRAMLAPFRGMSEGRDLFAPFLLEVFENDPYAALRQAAGQDIQGMVLLQPDKAKEIAADFAPQLTAIALRTDKPDVYESALSEVYEFQKKGYALSPDLMDMLRKKLGETGFSDVRGVMIARCLLEQGDEMGTAFLLGSLQQPTDMTVANWTLHLLGGKRVGKVAPTAEKYLLDKNNSAGRAEAAWALGNLLSEAGLRDGILKALSDALKAEKEPAVYREIAEALAQAGDPGATALLLDQAQGNESAPLRIQCIGALASAVAAEAAKGDLADKIVASFLEQSLRDADPALRARYVAALADIDGKASKELQEKIIAQCVSMMRDDTQFLVRAEAAGVLGRFPESPVTNDLLDALGEEKSQYVKVSIIRALAERRSPDAVKPLIEMLKTAEDRDTIAACADALSEMEGFSPDMLFDEYFSAGISTVGKVNVLTCLRQLKDEDGRIAKFLLERALPAETNDERRREIISDIGDRIPRGSPLEKEAVDTLLGILRDSADTETLRAAIDVLGTYKNEDTIGPIIAAAKKDPDVRLEALIALRRIGKAREDVVQFLLEIAASVNFANYQIYSKEITGVAEAVSSLDRAEISRMVRDRCLNEKDPKIRRAALSMSFVIDDPMFDSYLITTAKNPEEPPDVRSGAVLGLGMRKSHEAVPMLANMLGEDKGDMAESAAYALGVISDMRAFRPLLETIKNLRTAPPQKARLKEIAVFSLEQMTGQKFGDNTVAWEDWRARRRTMGPGAGDNP